MLTFITLVFYVVALWLLWTISRNTNDALDKFTAVQYEIVALEKRLNTLLAQRQESPESQTEKNG